MCHPARQHLGRLSVEGCEIIAAVADLPSQHRGPDCRHVRPSQRVGADELDRGAGQWVGCLLPAQQLRRGGIGDVPGIHHRDPHAADRLRIDARLQRVPEHQIVLHEVGRPQHGRGNGLRIDHPLDEVLARLRQPRRLHAAILRLARSNRGHPTDDPIVPRFRFSRSHAEGA